MKTRLVNVQKRLEIAELRFKQKMAACDKKWNDGMMKAVLGYQADTKKAVDKYNGF
jgi:hypothetical protein